MANDDRFCFVVEWHDSEASLNRKYQLLFYPCDNTVEMFDLKNSRLFLKRTKVDTIQLEDLYVGSTVTMLSRQLNIVDYGDNYTKLKLCSTKERTFGMIKPDAMPKMGEFIDMLCREGFIIVNMKMVLMSRSHAAQFYNDYKSTEQFNDMVSLLGSKPILVFELMGQNIVKRWLALAGPEDPALARSSAPMSIRARFGTDIRRNACHASSTGEAALRDINVFFSPGAPVSNTATFKDCTCCIIKPHAVKEGLAGCIISKILEANFCVSAIEMFKLEKANAGEFYEVYRGVVQEYKAMVDELTLGSCIVLEIRAENAPIAFREMAGPHDPEIARHLRPNTLRALFGRNKIQNAVHCTDLPDDGLLEVEYFFKVLTRA